jgi:ABC-2 type transport system ATP-binding protein
VTVADATPAVSVRGLGKEFGEGPVLDGIDFDVPAGEITLLMGPNGVGKTILLSCIAGGLHADDGEVSVFGRSPAEADSVTSFMLQDAMLVEELSGRENAAFFRDLHPCATDEWRAILEELSFEMDALDREVGDYSGGMKRKLELAVTLSVDVPLYLFDEPTAALDVTTVDTLHAILADRRDAGETILMSSHLPVDGGLADRLVLLAEDGLVAEGTPEELLAAVPRVVHVEGTVGDVSRYVRGGRFFEGETTRRGFLSDDTEAATVEGSTGEPGTRLEVREPTYTDLFNYYVHLAGEPR